MKYPDDFDDILVEDEAHLESLPPTTQTACLIHMLEAQVNNGGFDQFFFNSSGQFALQTLKALEAIEAPETRELLACAIALAYPDGYPNDASEHEQAADDDATLEAMGALSDEFFEYPEPLSDLVNEYLRGDSRGEKTNR